MVGTVKYCNGLRRPRHALTTSAAGYLMKVENHDGAGWNVQAEMTYNGLGTRMTSDALGVTTRYVSDGQLPLTIASSNKTIMVLYGLGPVAEKTDEWSYVLSDGLNVPRQLTDTGGEVTLSMRYNPWGKPIETNGIGNFDASYISTLIDTTTGLIYIGNGQYYDPETGRFLTRGVNPNSANPYVPWNPIGFIFAPLSLISIYYSRKKGKPSPWIAMIFLALILSACSLCTTTPPAQTNPPTNPPGGGSDGGGGTVTPPTETPPPTPTEPPTEPPLCEGCTPTSTFLGKFIMSAYYIPLESQYGEDSAMWPIYAVVHGDPGCKVVLSTSHKDGGNPYACESDTDKIRRARWDFLYDRAEGVCVQGTGKLNTGEYISCIADPDIPNEDVRFDWQLPEKVNRLENSVIPFETVATCDGIITLGTEIVIPELESYLYERGADTTLKVVDTGEGLCTQDSDNYNTLDLFVGEGKTALEVHYYQ